MSQSDDATTNSGQDNAHVLEAVDVTKTFERGRVYAVDDVSIGVRGREFLSVLGPSGSGKTTLLRIFAGLEEPDAGRVRLAGQDITDTPPHRRGMGFVFQDLALFPHLTVFENVAFGLRTAGQRASEYRHRVTETLDLVELPLGEFGARLPRQLSGGQRQRVALARILVMEPSVILFDEPMASLDRRLSDRMTVELRRLQRQVGFLAVYVTHDQDVALAISDRIAVMHEGRIIQTGGPVEVYARPRNRRVADFLGNSNLFSATVKGTEGDNLVVAPEGFDSPIKTGGKAQVDGEQVEICVRPEHFVPAADPANAAVVGQVEEFTFAGDSITYYVRMSDGQQIIIKRIAHEGEEHPIGTEFALDVPSGAGTVLEPI